MVRAAQEPDGYLDTYYAGERVSLRWSDLPTTHEMYCAGHLIQAAVAHQRATGTSELLEVAVGVAGNIERLFGPGRRPGADGHPGIEMALVELARRSGQRRWLELARWFVDQHGQVPPTISGKPYHQDHARLVDQREPVGHAVRGLYLYSAVADLVAETGVRADLQALEALWERLHGRRVYLTGGVGARWDDEAFGDDYELPNRRAHAETCAAVAHVFWAWRMLQLDGDGRYRDALETALFNAVLVGVSLTGDEFFYQNPLADRGGHRRAPWFRVACCPPNLARLLASLPAHLYSTGDDGLWVHLYAEGEVTTELPGGETVRIAQRTAYPWDGEVAIEVDPERPSEFALRLPVPAWAPGPPSVEVNGQAVGDLEVAEGGEADRDVGHPAKAVGHPDRLHDAAVGDDLHLHVMGIGERVPVDALVVRGGAEPLLGDRGSVLLRRGRGTAGEQRHGYRQDGDRAEAREQAPSVGVGTGAIHGPCLPCGGAVISGLRAGDR